MTLASVPGYNYSETYGLRSNVKSLGLFNSTLDNSNGGFKRIFRYYGGDDSDTTGDLAIVNSTLKGGAIVIGDPQYGGSHIKALIRDSNLVHTFTDLYQTLSIGPGTDELVLENVNIDYQSSDILSIASQVTGKVIFRNVKVRPYGSSGAYVPIQMSNISGNTSHAQIEY